MTKEELLDRLLSERAAWTALLAAVGETRMALPVLANDWSIRDVVAHVSWYEREATTVLRQRALRGSPWWELPTTERNAAIFAANQGRALADVLAEAGAVFADLLDALQDVTDADLMEAARFAEMPASWEPWQVVAENSYVHYQQHTAEIRDWLAQDAAASAS